MQLPDAEEDDVALGDHPDSPGLSDFAADMAACRSAIGVRRPYGGQRFSRDYISMAFSRLIPKLAATGLRDHQRAAVRAVAEHIADPARRPSALVTIPTAGGKTRSFQTIVAALASRSPDGSTFLPNVVVLVPTRILIRQTFNEFAQRFPKVPVASASSTRLVDAEGEPIPMGVRPVTLMTYQAFTAAAEEGRIRPSDIDLLVMDEAHRGLSDLRQSVLQPFLDECVVTAFTATPAFDEEKNVHNLLGPENEVYSISPQELRDRGVIAPVINYVMSISLDGHEPEDPAISRAVRRKALVDGTLDFIERRVEHDLGIALSGKIVVFYGSDRSHARMFADEYNRRYQSSGRHMDVVTGDDPPERIRDVMEAVRLGHTAAISNVGVLGEGFDLPKIGLVVNTPSSSKVKIQQQAGRMQRLDPDLPIHSADQIGFVIDTYYVINGRVRGRPRFMFESLGDLSIARTVSGSSRSFFDVDLSGLSTEALADDPGTARAIGNWSAAARRGRPDDTASRRRRRETARTSAIGAGFETSADIESIFRMLRLRDETPVPTRYEGVSMREFLDIVRTAWRSSPDVVAAFGELETTWRTAGTASFRGVEFAGQMRLVGRPSFCISPHDVPRLAEMLGRTVGGDRRIDAGAMFFAQTARTLHIDTSNPVLVAFWTELKQATAERRPLNLPDGPLWGEIRMSGSGRSLAVRVADLPRIAAYLNIKDLNTPKWSEKYLPASKAATRLGVASTNEQFVAAWTALVAADPVDRHGIRCGLMRSRGGVVAFYVHADDVGLFDRQFADGRLSSAPPKGPGDLAAHEMGKLVGISASARRFTRLFSAIFAKAEAGEPVVVGGATVACFRRNCGRRPAWCFRAEDARFFRQELTGGLPKRTENDLMYAEVNVALGYTKGATALSEFWAACAQAWSTGEDAVIGGAALRGRKVIAGDGSEIYCLARESLPEFIRVAVTPRGPRPKPGEVPITRSGFIATLRDRGQEASHLAVRLAFEELERTWLDTGVATLDGIDFEEDVVVEKGQWSFRIAPRELSRLDAAIGKPGAAEERKAPGRLVLWEVAQALRVSKTNAVLQAFWRVLEKATVAGRPVNVGDREIMGRVVRSGNQRRVSIATGEVPLLAAHLGIELAARRGASDLAESEPEEHSDAVAAVRL